MDADKSNSILIDVQTKLLDVMEIIKDLPQGYQFKVREMLSCAETVVSMYNDVQHGIIPEILQDGLNINTKIPAQEPEEVVQSEPEPPIRKVLDLSGIKINI
uniref:Uncharacterized protein n=1 Tax=Escherichia phage fEgEco12 TaxID=3158837 RepID=A0AAU7PI31_9CAUD